MAPLFGSWFILGSIILMVWHNGVVSNILREVENNRRRSLPSFRTEKRNKHARVLTVRQALQVWKNGGIFVDRLNNKGYELCMLSKYLRYDSSTLTSHFRKLMYCFHLESIFLDKINLKTVSEPFFSYGSHEILLGREFLSWNTLHISHIYKQPAEFISRRAPQQAGGDLLSLQWNAEKYSCLPNY